MWSCSQCGMTGIADDVRKCPACAYSRYSDLVLTGSAGSMTLRTSLTFGYKNLRDLIGEDVQFAALSQFLITRKDEKYLISFDHLSRCNPTLLNGECLSHEPIQLSNGDLISIGSKTNREVRKGEITVFIS